MNQSKAFISPSINFYTFGVTASWLTLIVSIVVGLSFRLLTQDSTIGKVIAVESNTDILYSFFSLVIIIPLIETTVAQLAVITALQKFKVSNSWIIFLATLIFSAGHLRNSTLSAINTIFTGFVLNYAYIYWFERTHSRQRAFEASLLVHSLHNFYALLLAFVPSPI